MKPGVYTAIITPFKSDQSLDLPAFQNIVALQAKAGIAGIIVCGTTGESPTVTPAERLELMRAARQTLQGSETELWAGTGTNCTRDSIALSQAAQKEGAVGLLLVTPYYNKPTPEGMEAHFRAIADAVSVDVMLYNVPGRTAVALPIETTVRLADHPRIRAIKEASGQVSAVTELKAKLGDRMAIYSGDDALFLASMEQGAVGVVSVASNLLPKQMVELFKTRSPALHRQLTPLFRDLFIESNPGPIKHAMAVEELCDEVLRLPLVPVRVASREKIQSAIASARGLSGGLSI